MNKKILFAVPLIILTITTSGIAYALHIQEKSSNAYRQLPKLKYYDARGKTDTISTETDKGTIITFVNTNCDFCIAEINGFTKYHSVINKKYKVYFISNEIADSVVNNKLYQNILKLNNYNFVFDKNYEIDKIYNISSIPSMFVYDKNKQLRKKYKGLTNVEKFTK